MTQGVLYIVSIVFGLSFGSFLNAWIWRTSFGRSIWKGRSVCATCKTVLRVTDTIPILSYIALKGKSFCCKTHISWQYPIVEASMAILFAVSVYMHQGDIVLIVKDASILFFLTFVFVYDLRYGEIWDKMTTIPAVLLFFIQGQLGILAWSNMGMGVLVGAGFFLVQFIISKGKWIGGGDIRMGVLMGVVLGWQRTILALLISYILGAVVGVYLLARKKISKKASIPFGTFLAVGSAIALFWGYDMIKWYLSLVYLT